MYQNIRAFVMGSIIMDMLLKLERVPLAGESYIGKDYCYVNGGKGANQAVSAARLGANVTYLGKTGDDANGALLKKGLEQNGISANLLLKGEKPSGLAVIMLEDNGQNRIAVFPQANRELNTAETAHAFDICGEQDIFLVQLETPQETVIEAVRQAAAKNIKTVLDAGPAQAFPLEKLVRLDILSPNESETFALCGIYPEDDSSAEEASKKLMERCNTKYVVIKRGGAGASVYDGKKIFNVPSYKVNVVDTTAAGDAFTAAMALEYAKSCDIIKAVKMGNIAGALAVQKLGAQPSLPYFEEFLSFYNNVEY